jgi:baculoviral IAP repeat-containing protein 6
MPQQSTLLQLFVTIQSILLVPEPYFLEPGFENQARSKTSDDYARNVQKNTLKVAIEDVWKNPPEGFEHVVKHHFEYQKTAIDAKAKAANLPQVQW